MAFGGFGMNSYTGKWTFEEAAHLVRRTGFGNATIAEVEALQRLGMGLAVERLLSFSDDDGTGDNPFDAKATFEQALQDKPQNAAARTVPTVQAWWLYKMIHSNQPLREKLTLFWHGHFASGLDKVRNGFALQQQNQLFRQRSLGNFQQFVLAVAQNPAMLRYLDNDENVKAHPNENFARELMELFTMGVHGGYSERDIQESARAFTGWTASRPKKRDDYSAAINPQFVFDQKNHDSGNKTFLGQSGNFDGADIVRIVSQQPSTPYFIGGKLWRFFISENPTQAELDALNAVWQKSNGNLREIMRFMLTSEAFYTAENRYTLIKSPLEYVVGTVRSSELQLEAKQIQGLLGILAQQSQIPLYPPNVKGWDGGLDWIADTTLLNRLTFIGALNSGMLAGARLQRKDVKTTANQGSKVNLNWPTGTNTAETIDLLGRTFLGQVPSGSLRRALEAYAKNRNSPEVVRGMAYLVLASPQYHLA
jgi:uncharacterized protein (DUF1800 family)